MEWIALLAAPEILDKIVFIALAIAAATPTEKDDTFIGRAVNLLRAVTSVFRPKKK